jgi:hypothetical protein
VVLGLDCNGLRLTPEEFDAAAEYDENYTYEIINGVVVVNPIPLAEEAGPKELLGIYLYLYRTAHAQGKSMDHTLPQQYVRTPGGRRLADRLIWTGLGRSQTGAVTCQPSLSSLFRRAAAISSATTSISAANIAMLASRSTGSSIGSAAP